MPTNTTAPKKRIFLVEDHPLLRLGLKLFIEHQADMEVCGEAGNAAEAFSAITALRPDAVVTDISMPGMNGIEFIKNTKALYPELAVVALSMHDEMVYAERALRAGALGYVMKKEGASEVITALRKAFLGEKHISEKVVGSIMCKALDRKISADTKSSSLVEILSDRELEVFEHIGSGENTSSIAAALGVSTHTVDTHRMHIKDKLQIGTMTELIQRAAVWVDRNSSGE